MTTAVSHSYTSSTITIQQQQPSALVMKLQGPAKSTAPEKAHVEPEWKILLAEMKEATENLPSEKKAEVLAMLTAWENKYNPALPERAARALAVLYFNLENTSFNIAVSEEAKLDWFDYACAIKEQLSEVLPQEQNSDAFLGRFKSNLEKQKCIPLLGDIRTEREKLYENANTASQEMAEKFEEVRSDLQNIHEAHELSATEIYAQVNAVTNDTTALYEEFGQTIKDLKQLERDLKAQENQTTQTCGTLADLLRKV